jgi:hypothetical protein
VCPKISDIMRNSTYDGNLSENDGMMVPLG